MNKAGKTAKGDWNLLPKMQWDVNDDFSKLVIDEYARIFAKDASAMPCPLLSPQPGFQLQKADGTVERTFDCHSPRGCDSSYPMFKHKKKVYGVVEFRHPGGNDFLKPLKGKNLVMGKGAQTGISDFLHNTLVLT